MNIADIRKDYKLQSLSEKDVAKDPIQQFEKWFQQAIDGEVPEPNALTLSTVSPQGKPSARILLLKGMEEGGFIFYTNYESKKAQELLQNPFASMTFHWVEMERQVRIEGRTQKLSQEQSTKYFQSRPKGSQIGAWVSPQSQEIPNRKFLETKQAELEEQFADKDVLEKPAHWGGYILMPDYIEFWQGRSSRLHDRIIYEQVQDDWNIKRLAP